MKKIVFLLGCLVMTGCGNGCCPKEKLLRTALARTNVALTVQADRADARQAQAERLARQLYPRRKGQRTN